MAEVQKGFSHLGFTKTFILPALLIFLVPGLTLAFFLHAQNKFDTQFREEILNEIRADNTHTPEEREKVIKLFTEQPFSRLILNEDFAKLASPEGRFNYFTFRWMIRLSILSIVAGILVIGFAGLCVVLSFSSQWIQYLTLSISWQVLRIYGAIQTLVQGLMVVALSFWVTVLWFQRFSPKLIILAGAAVVLGAIAVVVSIFKRINIDQTVEGELYEEDLSSPLHQELNAICAKVGTAPPDHVILGIDDNFFVTENPTIVNGRKLTGRTLFLSLALLKHLNGAEAEAILAHEMAHYSGQDTLYSRKITPLLIRYAHYLQALQLNPLTLPIFYFMHAFRALYEVSLSRMSRKREFRADKISAEVSSPINFAQALIRIICYSEFRGEIQKELFDTEQTLETADIANRIEAGFRDYSRSFASKRNLAELESNHPFDSHPALAKRLEALGIPCEPDYVAELLKTPGDGRWYDSIDNAFGIEREQWDVMEDRFRQFHEQTLPYRFLPETEEEIAVVLKFFPEVRIDGKDVLFIVNYQDMQFGDWTEPVKFSEVTNFDLTDNVLTINYQREGKKKHVVKLKPFGPQLQTVVDTINKYYARHSTAVAYQQHKKAEAATATSEVHS
ncbi:MAG: M48 family metalloprotease [Planctomycetaceae bacterium]|nr:M48 family metalloprotease [Planctomycetaceae bacterium]